MPFLGFGNYAKPGPGVSKDEEEKSVWLKFFIIFKRRLSKFMQLNLIFMIPMLIIAALMFAAFIVPGVRYEMQINLNESIISLKLWEMYAVPFPLVFLSPFWAGVMVVSRRLANEEYAFVWSEYWKGVKDNWKQFTVNGIFLYVMYILLSFSFIYYAANLSNGWLSYIPFGMIILVTVLLCFSQYYVSVMMVSVNLKLTHIYKNAFIFALMGLGRNFLMTVIMVALIILFTYVFWMMGILMLLGAVLFILILFSFVAYMTSYIAFPMVQRYIIDPYENKGIIKNPPAEKPAQDDFEYLRDELDSEDPNAPKYVYVNGKLVKSDADGDDEEQIFTDRT